MCGVDFIYVFDWIAVFKSLCLIIVSSAKHSVAAVWKWKSTNERTISQKHWRINSIGQMKWKKLQQQQIFKQNMNRCSKHAAERERQIPNAETNETA